MKILEITPRFIYAYHEQRFIVVDRKKMISASTCVGMQWLPHFPPRDKDVGDNRVSGIHGCDIVYQVYDEMTRITTLHLKKGGE